MPDTRSSVETLLVDVERQLDQVDAGLMATEPSGLQAACTDLRSVAVAFARMLEAALSAEAFDHAFRRRIEAVAQRLATQREALARRNFVVERALASIMRRAQGDATYSVPGERSSFGAGSYAAH
ncbi:MAG: hypothetical protein KJ832_18975 [Gammaproteobacteria bacterium]|nr:hypothetical protein [Gammaproteobacteria bacterium]